MEKLSLLEEYNSKLEEMKNAKVDTTTTRGKILEIDNALEEISNWIKVKNLVAPIEFSYWKSTNSNLIKNEVEAIRSTIEPSEKFKEFTTKREDLAKTNCMKTADNIPDLITSPNGLQQYQFDTQGQVDFNSGLGELLTEYDEVLIETNAREILVNEFIQKEVDRPKYYKLDLTDVSDEISLDPWFNLLHNEGLFDDSKLKKD